MSEQDYEIIIDLRERLEKINELMVEIYDIGKSSEFASSFTHKQFINLKKIKELSDLG